MNPNTAINSQGYFLDNTLIIPDDKTDLEYLAKTRYTEIADTINLREIGVFPLAEVETGQQWYTPGNPQQYRQVFRKVIPIGSVAAGPGTAVNHGITSISRFTNIYGTGNAAGPLYYALPYSEAGGTGNVEVQVSDVSVTVILGATAPALTDVEVVLEYIKV